MQALGQIVCNLLNITDKHTAENNLPQKEHVNSPLWQLYGTFISTFTTKFDMTKPIDEFVRWNLERFFRRIDNFPSTKGTASEVVKFLQAKRPESLAYGVEMAKAAGKSKETFVKKNAITGAVVEELKK